jgi:hypothetical protein
VGVNPRWALCSASYLALSYMSGTCRKRHKTQATRCKFVSRYALYQSSYGATLCNTYVQGCCGQMHS